MERNSKKPTWWRGNLDVIVWIWICCRNPSKIGSGGGRLAKRSALAKKRHVQSVCLCYPVWGQKCYSKNKLSKVKKLS